jgi:hypothetical protein
MQTLKNTATKQICKSLEVQGIIASRKEVELVHQATTEH